MPIASEPSAQRIVDIGTRIPGTMVQGPEVHDSSLASRKECGHGAVGRI